MISIEELKKAKEKRKTSLYHSEKEYLQYIFLNAISRYGEEFVFKGGTCLRIAYELERASEDLDFNTTQSMATLRETIKLCLKDYEMLNISCELYAEKEYEGNYRAEIRCKGPLYNGATHSTNTVKVDFSRRKIQNRQPRLIRKLFSDIPPFVIVTLSLEEILAEKIRALLMRKAPRDLYDVWILFGMGVETDKALLKRKLAEDRIDRPALRLPEKREYERDLKALLDYVPPYDPVAKKVKEELEKVLG